MFVVQDRSSKAACVAALAALMFALAKLSPDLCSDPLAQFKLGLQFLTTDRLGYYYYRNLPMVLIGGMPISGEYIP